MKLAQKSHCGGEEIYYRNKSDYPDISLALGSECCSWDVFHRSCEEWMLILRSRQESCWTVFTFFY